MLQEIKDLQNHAVSSLINILPNQKIITFKAPTGSGKTYMMSDFMNRVLSHEDAVFLVSSLSKSDLARQNYEKFVEYDFFNHINPYLINSEYGVEEKVYIPDTYNVYVLPRDLYKSGSRIKNSGALFNLLLTLKFKSKVIYLIKDECHIATNNLDELNSYFDKIINFSATPHFSPDVEISNEAAVRAKLIKKLAPEATTDEEKQSLYYVNPDASIEEAIDKFLSIRGEYFNKLKVNPCMIIQISNKDKGEEEWKRIKQIVDDPNKGIKWMYIVDKDGSAIKGSDTNDSVKKLPISKWKDYAKSSQSTIDIIIFKMVITEGWDIPRACMLYQVRDAKSKQMDEQVIGRVRRNPILLNWELFDEEAHRLALTSWVWGIIDGNLRKFKRVNLVKNRNIQVQTTKLNSIEKRTGFNLPSFLSANKNDLNTLSIFELYKKWSHVSNETNSLCWEHIKTVDDWKNISNVIELIDFENTAFMENYEQSMEIDDISGFPESSYFETTNFMTEIDEWSWELNNPNDDEYYFDSEAEKEFAKIIKRLGTRFWGKNYYPNSNIKFEYVLGKKHTSYPDFIIKDKRNNIHIVEVKSINKGYNANIDEVEYIKKVNSLRKAYLQASKITSQYFYLPIKKDNDWIIYKFFNGSEVVITKKEFINSIKF